MFTLYHHQRLWNKQKIEATHTIHKTILRTATQAEKTPSPIAIPYNPYFLVLSPQYLRNRFELRPAFLLSISFRPPLEIEFVPAVLVGNDRWIEDLAAEEIGEVDGGVCLGGVGVAEETRVGEGPAEEVWGS